ncbi:MAG: hypothetical protein M1829_002372 [Trizodia sp. TS-e1964]|nr:MAG: hypothetical protein M1829_002372 [Trizodia sp. TS-e1964]
MPAIQCGPVRSLQNLAIAIGTLKMLDIFMRRNHLPRYTASKTLPSPAIFSLILFTELRYESFTPNHIRVPKKKEETFSEPIQLAIHTGAFAVLQALPQMFPTILAFEVLLAIYILWTSIQQLLRYPNSPALFGPLYRAESLTLFWSETWHNVFSSPCTSLAYYPIRKTLSRLGAPAPVARSAGVIGAFALMGVFHMYALHPILPWASLVRIGLFFLLNGIAAVCEAAVWGHKKSWLKTALAWTFETLLATWTAQAAHIPNGLSHIPWGEMCTPAAAL